MNPQLAPRPAPRLPPPTPLQIVAALTLGAAGLITTGLTPVLLGPLLRAGRLTGVELGLTAMGELLAMGLACGGAGALLKPQRMRALMLAAALGAAAMDLAAPALSHLWLLAARALAGGCEGMLLWAAIAMIARQPTPERLAALFLTGQVATQFVAAGLVSAWLAPRFGPPGAFAAIAVSALIAALASRFVPDQLSDGPSGAAAIGTGPPPGRGWIALGAMFAFTAAGSGVFVYLDSIAARSGLGPGVVGAAVQMNLIGQVAGGALAAGLAGRVRYPVIFLAAAGVYFTVYSLYTLSPPGWAFAAATGATGFLGMLTTPYFTPMSLDADPSRRAAGMSGGAQLLGGAAGPLLAAPLSGRIPVILALAALWIALAVGVALYLALSHRSGEGNPDADFTAGRRRARS